jgi:menaquinone-9 beta-reductase
MPYPFFICLLCTYARCKRLDFSNDAKIVKSVIIIGGGLSGMITGIQLVRAGIRCTIIERKKFPMHRVCGEFISNETVPFLRSMGLFPEEFGPSSIKQFQLTSVNGRSVVLPLDLGGFGISRYTYDNFLFKKATQHGVDFHLNTEAEKIDFQQEQFGVKTTSGNFTGDVVIGSFGKRSKIDVSMQRSFVKKRSPYIGVKYHLRTNHPDDLIALHNFQDGYCGISNVEEGKTNLCYLSHRNNLKQYGSIQRMEEAVLFRNPFLHAIFKSATFLFEKPETINEISFETKGPVQDHVLMSGDAAGMITPLCGNGMAMAIHSAKILSSHLIPFCQSNLISRQKLENEYSQEWRQTFENRLWTGRQVQRLFGTVWASNLAVSLARHAKPMARLLIKKTHGNPF